MNVSDIQKFKFTCGLCKKDVKRGDKFSVDMFESDDDTSSTGFECEDEICKQCATKIQNKINSLRKQPSKPSTSAKASG
tara:strand:- start:23 stop:259 length:237 start_codon:yes stop_codon:yes gene_type:complete